MLFLKSSKCCCMSTPEGLFSMYKVTQPTILRIIKSIKKELRPP